MVSADQLQVKTNPHITVFGFGVRFEIWFFVSMALLASRSHNLERSLVWIALVTVSILVHELGHAMAYRYYGCKARITMWGMGGLTHGSDTGHLTPQQRIVVAAAGSTVEMAVLGAPAWLLQTVWGPGGWLGLILHWLIWINVVWALVNLAPVWPMDGGNILNELLYLRAGTSRRQLTHHVSIVTGVIAAAVAYWQGLSWGGFLFLYFVVINLFAAGIFRTKSNIGLWPGVTTGGGHERGEAPRPKKASSKDMMGSGYRSLRTESGTFAADEARRVMATSKSSHTRSGAAEMLVWATLVDGKSLLAAQGFAELDKPSKSLTAVMVIEAGHDQVGIAALATAIQQEAKLPAAEQAILYAARSGHIAHVVDALLTHGTVGLGHAVRVQHSLDVAGMTTESSIVGARI